MFLHVAMSSPSLAAAPDAAVQTLSRLPKLAYFLFERRLSNAKGGAAIGVKAEQMRRYCLPIDDPNRVVPPPRAVEKIKAWTGGIVGPADHYEPLPAVTAPPDEAMP